MLGSNELQKETSSLDQTTGNDVKESLFKFKLRENRDIDKRRLNDTDQDGEVRNGEVVLVAIKLEVSDSRILN